MAGCYCVVERLAQVRGGVEGDFREAFLIGHIHERIGAATSGRSGALVDLRVRIADGDSVGEGGQVGGQLRILYLIGVSRVDRLILWAHLQQAARGAIGRARLSVATCTRIVVARIELSYRHAGLLSRTAEVLPQQGSERERPAQRVR